MRLPSKTYFPLFLVSSTLAQVPDATISKLYPLADNYVIEDNGLRSPKNLADLCIEAVCRSLPSLEDNGLPSGLPQDVVDDVVASLTKHSAMNATTLRLLRNCELASLSLVGSRGVTDEWLKPLRTSAARATTRASLHASQEDEVTDVTMQPANEMFFNTLSEENSQGKGTTSSSSSYVSASSALLPSASESNVVVPDTPSHVRVDVNGDLDMSISSSFDDGQTCHVDPGSTADHAQTNPHQSPANTTTSSMILLDLRGSHRLSDKGLMHLSDLESLEVAKLDGCFALQGRGLLAFSSSTRLRSLSLANCRRLTDEAIVNISHLSSLEALSLDGCRCLTDRSLRAISSLYSLTQLDLSQCDLITDVGLAHLNDLEWIEELSLGWCRSISDRGIHALCSQVGRGCRLRVLNLARLDVSDEGLGQLIKLRSLEELNLNGCTRINSSSLGSVLENLPSLTSLDVSHCPGILYVVRRWSCVFQASIHS